MGIAESKLSYEIMDDAAQTFLKSKIMDNIHKYFYMICFSGYVREASVLAKDKSSNTPAIELKMPKTFVAYMEEHAALRTMVEEGKGKLQWERPIPPEALASLETLANADFQANLVSTLPSLSTVKLVSLVPPPDVSPPVSSRSSRLEPLLKAWWKLFLV